MRPVTAVPATAPSKLLALATTPWWVHSKRPASSRCADRRLADPGRRPRRQGFSKFMWRPCVNADRPISQPQHQLQRVQQVSLACGALRRIEAEAGETPVSDRCSRWARAWGAAPGASGSAYDPTKPCCGNLQLTAAPGQLAPCGASEPARAPSFPCLLRFNTAQRGRCCSTARTGRMRAADSAPCHRPGAPAELRGSPERWQRRSAFDASQQRAGAPGKQRLANAADFIEALRWLRGPDREAGQQFFVAVTATLAIARAVLGNPACCCSMSATSALDAESRGRRCKQGLEQAMAGRPVLVIAHRPRPRAGSRPDPWCSRPVASFEQGTTTQLMARDGRLPVELCNRQSISGRARPGGGPPLKRLSTHLALLLP